MKVINLSSIRSQRVLADLTAEQRLKLLILQQLLGAENVTQALSKGASVDSLFTLTAEDMLGKSIPFFKG
jgi:hypothetical protein